MSVGVFTVTINLIFRNWANTGMVASINGHTVCNNCGNLSLVTFSKPLKCTKCAETLSEYSAYVQRTVNSRMMYYAVKEGNLYK